jgi:hypothetical protein
MSSCLLLLARTTVPWPLNSLLLLFDKLGKTKVDCLGERLTCVGKNSGF